MSNNITGLLVEELGSAIVSGKYGHQGMIPSEKDLSDSFGVSRTVVREATKILGAKQMIFSRTSRGTWIYPESEWNLFDSDILRWLMHREFCWKLLLELNEMRKCIEPSAAYLAAKRCNEEQIEILEQALDSVRIKLQEGGDFWSERISFHLLILSASENRFYQQFSSFVHMSMKYQFWGQQPNFKSTMVDLGLYERIVECISFGQGERASSTMQKILSLSCEHTK